MTTKHAFIAVAAAAVLSASLGAAAAGYIDSADKVAQVRSGATTAKQLEEMFGAPLRKLRFGQREVWEYEAPDGGRRVVISISLGANGVVQDIARIRQDGGA